jgi:hypothetical protein
MYEVVTDQTQRPLITILEAELEAIYCFGLHSEHTSYLTRVSVNATLLVSHRERQKCDLLRQFLTRNNKGFFLEIRFSHDEFSFISSLTRWLARFSDIDLALYPDLTELVVRVFRQGTPIEILPMTDLNAYSGRWEKSLWHTIQAYKMMTRDLHENYQIALKEWSKQGMPWL